MLPSMFPLHRRDAADPEEEVRNSINLGSIEIIVAITVSIAFILVAVGVTVCVKGHNKRQRRRDAQEVDGVNNAKDLAAAQPYLPYGIRSQTPVASSSKEKVGRFVLPLFRLLY
jgi:hypothetical protein